VAPGNLDPDQGLAAALAAAGPADGLADQLAVFGQFIGSWKIDWYGPAAGEEPVSSP
jgi:hypothetical protein